MVTICDRAAAESCPMFFGGFARTHWGQPDLVAAGDAAAQQRASEDARATVVRRVRRQLDQPLASIPRAEWRGALDRSGRDDA